MREPVHFVPVITTLIALAFSAAVFRRYRERGGQHLLWWSIGLATYAIGAGTEAATTLLGWHESIFRAWYITGALLGGAPLAQGSVYLHLPRRTANYLTVALVLVVSAGAAFVLLSPIDYSLIEPFRLSGKVLVWHWVRLVSPFVNLYALVFLAGGAAVSAIRFARTRTAPERVIGNVCIAVGAVLPGIGGTFTRFGHTEVLYVTELLGLVLIYAGYRASIRATAISRQFAATVNCAVS